MTAVAARVMVVCLLVSALPVRAGITVSIGEAADPDARFRVKTRSSHALFHGSQHRTIDERFMRPGETAKISVIALNPVTFSYVYTSIYHPEYIYDSKLLRELPSVFNRVRIPEFEPRSWRGFIDAGEKVLHAGKGIHLGNVVGHFKLFIESYLPAADAAGLSGRRNDYLPLFEELISHTRKTLPYTNYGMDSIDERRRQDPDYARRLDQTEQGKLRQLDELLLEIRALLSLGAEERIRLRSLQGKMTNTRAVYDELMTAGDRRKVDEFLEFQFQNSRAHPRPEKTRQWVNSGNHVSYRVTLGDHYTLNDQGGQRLYENCYRTGLNVVLYAGVKTDLKNLQKGVRAQWHLLKH